MTERRIRTRNYYVRRPMAEPFRATIGWRDVAECIGGTVVLLVLFIGLPFLLWLAGSAR